MSDIEIGAKFGAWKVMRVLDGSRCLTLCTACGTNVQRIRLSDLRRGKSLMCKKCSHSAKNGTTTDPKTQEVYNSWVSMNQRCYNTSSKDYKNYGARNITVHPVWRDSFEAFFMYIGPRPTSDCTIERLDYNKGYEPGNVTWLPRAEQPLNKRDNVRIKIGDKDLVVSQWPDEPECTVNQFTIYKRIKRNWPPEAAVLCPSGMPLKVWLEEHNSTIATLT